MIKSKLNRFYVWTPLSIFFFVSIMSALALIYDHIERDRYAAAIFFVIYFFLTLSSILMIFKSIVIDLNSKTITIKHYITSQTWVCNFQDIQGYLDVIQKPARGKSFRTIYLIQNNKVIQEISGSIFSNLDEIELGFQQIKYLGRKKYSFFDNYRILFKMKFVSN